MVKIFSCCTLSDTLRKNVDVTACLQSHFVRSESLIGLVKPASNKSNISLSSFRRRFQSMRTMKTKRIGTSCKAPAAAQRLLSFYLATSFNYKSQTFTFAYLTVQQAVHRAHQIPMKRKTFLWLIRSLEQAWFRWNWSFLIRTLTKEREKPFNITFLITQFPNFFNNSTMSIRFRDCFSINLLLCGYMLKVEENMINEIHFLLWSLNFSRDDLLPPIFTFSYPLVLIILIVKMSYCI